MDRVKSLLQEKNHELIGQHLEKTTEELGKYVFKYGKQKGNSFTDVLKQDPDYCAWVLSKRITKENPDLFLFFIYLKRQL